MGGNWIQFNNVMTHSEDFGNRKPIDPPSFSPSPDQLPLSAAEQVQEKPETTETTPAETETETGKQGS